MHNVTIMGAKRFNPPGCSSAAEPSHSCLQPAPACWIVASHPLGIGADAITGLTRSGEIAVSARSVVQPHQAPPAWGSHRCSPPPHHRAGHPPRSDLLTSSRARCSIRRFSRQGRQWAPPGCVRLCTRRVQPGPLQRKQRQATPGRTGWLQLPCGLHLQQGDLARPGRVTQHRLKRWPQNPHAYGTPGR